MVIRHVASFVGRAAALGMVVARLARRPPAAARVAVARPDLDVSAVSVVIPARDEADRIGPCLAALVGAGVREVIVVDDESTDSTAELAAAHGAVVVAGRPVPPGWAGKAWALQQGVEAASGAVVLTLDADTRPAPTLPAFVVEQLGAGLDFLTVAARFDCPTPGSRFLHPSLLTTLVYRYGRPDGVPLDRPLLANGQCMAFRRDPFLASGGMTPVGGEVVEDVALARHLAARGWKVGFVPGPEHLTVRMYESFTDTWTGWGRSIALPGVERPAAQWRDAVLLTVVLAGPWWRVARGRFDVVDAAAFAVRLGTLFGTASTYASRGVSYWSSPLADPLAVGRVVLSVARPARAWRGRATPSRTAPR